MLVFILCGTRLALGLSVLCVLFLSPHSGGGVFRLPLTPHALSKKLAATITHKDDICARVCEARGVLLIFVIKSIIIGYISAKTGGVEYKVIALTVKVIKRAVKEP